ncbi:hypothetical protein D6825_00560 [Candidatus Woesearchaeota archaeon]|nr:MAG: hypothetical protein D6825_00560 [Candidatus Woesearchaeota archaeon]
MMRKLLVVLRSPLDHVLIAGTISRLSGRGWIVHEALLGVDSLDRKRVSDLLGVESSKSVSDLSELSSLANELKVDVVLAPDGLSFDCNGTLLSYSDKVSINGHAFVDISDYWKVKIAVMDCYDVDEDLYRRVRWANSYFGSKLGSAYAEAFDMVNISCSEVVLKSLNDFIR